MYLGFSVYRNWIIHIVNQNFWHNACRCVENTKNARNIHSISICAYIERRGHFHIQSHRVFGTYSNSQIAPHPWTNLTLYASIAIEISIMKYDHLARLHWMSEPSSDMMNGYPELSHMSSGRQNTVSFKWIPMYYIISMWHQLHNIVILLCWEYIIQIFAYSKPHYLVVLKGERWRKSAKL